MTSLLRGRDVTVKLNNTTLVETISVDLQARRAVTLLGESGSGKSLFAQALLGTLPGVLRAEGELDLHGDTHDLSKPGSLQANWGRHLAVLPQEPWLALNPLKRAGEQVAEVYRLVCSVDNPRAKAEADLSSIGLGGCGRSWPWQLSGGMAQRLAFMASRAGGARVVVADEPTKGLDAARRDDVLRLLQRGLGEGGSVLTITHDLALARGLGGEVLVMREGRVVERGPAEQVLNAPTETFTRKLIGADPSAWPPRQAAAVDFIPVVEAKGIGLSRGGNTLLSDFHLQIHRGDVLGIRGPSGCGKSSLGNVLLGQLKPQAGRVWRNPGYDNLHYQKLWQDPPAAFPRHVTLGQGLRDLIKRHWLDAREVPELMARLGLSEALLERKPGEVSGGELQRISLLRVLLLKPVFVFADEPTSRLDPLTQQETMTLLLDFARERQIGLLLVSHDDALLQACCDRVISLEAQHQAETLTA